MNTQMAGKGGCKEDLEDSVNTLSCGISFPVEGDVMYRRGGVKSSNNERNREVGVVSY